MIVLLLKYDFEFKGGLEPIAKRQKYIFPFKSEISDFLPLSYLTGEIKVVDLS